MNYFPKAYNELVGLILDEEDVFKFEWVIGAILSDGPKCLVTVRGPSGSGKTTLTNIVKKVIFSPYTRPLETRVDFFDSRTDAEFDQRAFVFVELNHMSGMENDAVSIVTTGNRVPVNKHHVLMQMIDSEVNLISQMCVDMYEELGEDRFTTAWGER